MFYERFQETGELYPVAELKDGEAIVVLKRKKEEHCNHCDKVIKNRNPELEVYLHYKYSDSCSYGFCSYVCISDWALQQGE